MKIPFSWLLDHVELDVTPERLGEDLTSVGLALDGLERSGDDSVLDLDITTNRVDCMNVRGVAREAAVIYRRPLRPLDTSFTEKGDDAREALEVEIASSDLCGRFAARILDVRVGPSPDWVRSRLEAAGVRSISSVVDVTNYVMLELGQPTHAFDLALVPGCHLLARWARAGEHLTTLDGVDRELRPEIGIVACPEGPLALAGVMGGASSEVSERQRASIALEAAYWEPMAIRRAARRLGHAHRGVAPLRAALRPRSTGDGLVADCPPAGTDRRGQHASRPHRRATEPSSPDGPWSFASRESTASSALAFQAKTWFESRKVWASRSLPGRGSGRNSWSLPGVTTSAGMWTSSRR